MTSKPLPMTPARLGVNVIASTAVPEHTAFLVPGPMPTRTATADEAERWARGVVRVDGLTPAEAWYAIRSTPLTPKGKP